MFFKYLRFEYKNAFRQLFKQFIALFIIILLLTIAIVTVMFVTKQNNSIKPIRVGLVIDDNDNATKMITQYISQMASVKSVADFIEMGEEQAFEELRDENISAVISCPENFYADINNGLNPPFDVYINDNDAITKAFAIVLKSGVRYIRVSEASVYSFIELKRSGEYQYILEEEHIGDFISLIYADLILKKSHYFDNTVVSTLGNLNVNQFYFIGIIISFSLFLAMGFGGLYSKQSNAIERLIIPINKRRLQLSFIKEIVISTFVFIFMLFTYFSVLAIGKLYNIEILYFDLIHLLVLFILSYFIAASVNCFYIVTGDQKIYGLGVIGVIIVVLLSGVWVPVNILPIWFSHVVWLNPVYYLYSFGKNGLFKAFDLKMFGMLIFFYCIYKGIIFICEKE